MLSFYIIDYNNVQVLEKRFTHLIHYKQVKLSDVETEFPQCHDEADTELVIIGALTLTLTLTEQSSKQVE